MEKNQLKVAIKKISLTVYRMEIKKDLKKMGGQVLLKQRQPVVFVERKISEERFNQLWSTLFSASAMFAVGI
jgi:hypothetical protein